MLFGQFVQKVRHNPALTGAVKSLSAMALASAALLSLATAPAQAAGIVPVHSFTGIADDGATPQGGLILGPDGALYGVTVNGGTGAQGTVYKIKTDGTYVTLHSFVGTDGANPQGALFPRYTKSGFDAFYGTTSAGGANGFGTIYKVKTDGTFATVYDFKGQPDAANPTSGLFSDLKGNLYGTTPVGGVNGNGAIYRLSNAGEFAVLYSFSNFDVDGANADGAYPFASLVLNFDGKFYGVANFGGTSGRGTVFSITTGGVFKTVHSFTPSEGAAPAGALLPVGANLLVGTTTQGGDNQSGTVFKVTTAGKLTTLHSFSAVDIFTGTNADGSNPQAALFPYLSTNKTLLGLYGVAAGAGPNAQGTVYKIGLDGSFSVVAAFTGGAEGGTPVAPLFIALDGNLYGTALGGGDAGFGTVYRLTLP